ARAAYRLPTERRGVFALGPLEISRSDAFGLAATSTVAAPATQLTVYPHIDVIAPLPHTIGHDPYAGTDHPNALGNLGEDFYALRPYELGDDLRRVHWKSTARADELMIRQDEMPWQGRVTVLLDHRRRAHSAETLELVEPSSYGVPTRGEVAPPPPTPGTQVVRVTAETPFPVAWNTAMAMARSPRLGARS